VIGIGLGREFGEPGRQYFHEVSRYYPGYNPQETDTQFNNCLKYKDTQETDTQRIATISSLFDIALQHGIKYKQELKLMDTKELQKLAAESIGEHNHIHLEDLLKLMNQSELKKLIESGYIIEAEPLINTYYLKDSTPF
jgi:hypothetical protein